VVRSSAASDVYKRQVHALTRVLLPGDHLAVGDAFDIEQQVFEFVGWVSHERDAFCKIQIHVDEPKALGGNLPRKHPFCI
jgi:hypothetical protein